MVAQYNLGYIYQEGIGTGKNAVAAINWYKRVEGFIVHLHYMSPSSLANLIANRHGLRVFCGACHSCRDLDVDALAQRYGPAMELPEIGRRARCKCGHKGGSVQVVAVRW